MILLSLPWLEFAVVVPLLGALVVGRRRAPDRAAAEALLFAALTFVCATLAALAFSQGFMTDPRWDFQQSLFGARVLNLDELNAPLLPTVALLYLLTAVATGRTKVLRFSFPWSLAALGLQLAAFACVEPWVLIALLAVGAILPIME